MSNKEKTSEDLKSQLASLVPEKLNDIVKINRHQLTFEYVDINHTADLMMDLPTTNIKHEMHDAFLYRRVVNVPSSQSAYMCLVGFVYEGNREIAWHTSTVTGVDVSNMMFKTRSGSYYRVKNFVEGEAHVNLLMHICAVAHQEGWGDHFGISPIFY